METRFDVVVVGAGIVGLATAMRLLERRPGLRLAVVDKEAAIGRHQTSHNSGVIHRGVYYAPGSLKARLCTEGARRLTAFCDEHDIAYRLCGKLILAVDEAELPALDELERRARANGVPGLRRVDAEQVREIEPHARAVSGLYSPQTGIVDYAVVAAAYAGGIQEAGGEIRLGSEVRAIEVTLDEVAVRAGSDRLRARAVITCAGLQSDRLAAMTEGHGDDLRIVPFRGGYYALTPSRTALVNGLIYPVPDPRFPFLGVHFTPRMDGSVWAGPNAVLAFAREGYRYTTISPRDLASALAFPGMWRVAGRYWRTGLAEMWRGASRRAYAAALRRYLPELRASDLVPAGSGVRAQALRSNGELVDDFVFSGSGRAIHVRNAPSPAATSSLAIADEICDRAFAQVPDL